ncbi:MAG: hypothetical protein GY841_15855 [FCB group bacterium]|nr:hypothetical protein [FCB group bacterium]
MKKSQLRPIKGVKFANGALSRSDFKKIQKAFGFTSFEMADALAMKRRTIIAMRSGERNIAPWTVKLMQYVAKERGFIF